jgi:hypothetical protein
VPFILSRKGEDLFIGIDAWVDLLCPVLLFLLTLYNFVDNRVAWEADNPSQYQEFPALYK